MKPRFRVVPWVGDVANDGDYGKDWSFYFDVIDETTGLLHLRLRGEADQYWASIGFEGPERVEVSPDGTHVVVHDHDATKPRTAPLGDSPLRADHALAPRDLDDFRRAPRAHLVQLIEAAQRASAGDA